MENGELYSPPSVQRLAGATLLVFANKQDLPGALSKDAIQEVANHRAVSMVFTGHVTFNRGSFSCRRWPWTRSRATTGASSAAAR